MKMCFRWVFYPYLLLLFYLSFFLYGCSSPPEITPLVLEPQTSNIPSITPVTKTPAPTSTASPTPAPTAIPIPTATPPESLSCWTEGGFFEHGQWPTSLLREPMDYRVYLPPCYSQEPERRYPVLYLIHGQSYNDDQWERLGAGSTADALIADGEIPPFIIVMPRDRVWTNPKENNFGIVLAEEIVPNIDERYRTLADRQFRAVGGLSRGAGWAVHLGLSRWELFGAIGAHSLPVFWSDVYSISSWLDAIPPEELPRIYLDIGDKDRDQILASARWFEEHLTIKAVPHEWYLFPGYHEERYWSTNMERYLRWYAHEW
jgi:enterochelin esterase-like enzyme